MLQYVADILQTDIPQENDDITATHLHRLLSSVREFICDKENSPSKFYIDTFISDIQQMLENFSGDSDLKIKYETQLNEIKRELYQNQNQEESKTEYILESFPSSFSKKHHLNKKNNNLNNNNEKKNKKNGSDNETVLMDSEKTKQDDLVAEIGSLAQQFRSTANAIQTALNDDDAVIQESHQHLERNLWRTRREQGSLDGHISRVKAHGMSTLTMLVTTVLLFMGTYMFIIKIFPSY
eukprot:gb/GECH01014548.1/.p1 GENE.gb/GECH01014548.1/~~gb/GECH01014548.1/.p1  ORF type:complete len:238 (+),score=72.40 gb/GECH01014548.1/:1-714(+)